RDDDDVHARRGRRRPRGYPRGPRRQGSRARRPLGRRQSGGDVPSRGRADDDRALARLRDLPRRRHGLAQARRADAAGRRVLHRGPRQPERDVPQPSPDRVGAAERRRRAADRQVPAHVPPQMTVTEAPTSTRLLTIGSVCSRLKGEFADISISKIRYLEDQGLLAPRRTQGGYRLFSEEDVERLETILRLQRDEFLPLRVIREELSSPGAVKGAKKRRGGLSAAEHELDVGELCERAGVTPSLARELEEFGLLAPRTDNGTKLYGEGDADVAATCAKLARYGIS